MLEKNNECRIWIKSNPNKEQVINNQFDETLLLNMGRVFEDKEHKKEIEPFCILSTLEMNGKEKDCFFTLDQLSQLIVQLSSMRNKMIKRTERLFDLRFGIKPQPKKKQPDANNLCKDFNYKQDKPQHYDRRRKNKGKRTH